MARPSYWSLAATTMPSISSMVSPASRRACCAMSWINSSSERLSPVMRGMMATPTTPVVTV
jgi:hypothetical protein